MAATTRPTPMNASPHHAKVKVTLQPSDSYFIAGDAVSGKIDMECKADKGLGIGVIKVELFAIEELTSRDHSATSTFAHGLRLFQGPGLPPSNAVLPHPLPGDGPLPAHHFPARRGQTSFLFRIPLAATAPASIDFGRGLAQVRYVLRATVGVAWKGELRLVTDEREVRVEESVTGEEDGVGDGAECPSGEAVGVGENGKIWAQARIVGGVLVAGHSACVELQVKNHSAKKNTGLTVALSRHLHLPSVPPSDKQPLQISDTLTSVNFRGAEYIVPPGVEGVAQLVFDIPKTARGVRGGLRVGDEDQGRTSQPLFEVRCFVAVRITMGIGNKDIHLDVPVQVVHPAVVPPVPLPEHYDLASPQLYSPHVPLPPTSPLSYDNRPMSPYAYPLPVSPPPMSPYAYVPAPSPHPQNAYPYHPSVASPPPQAFADQNHVWLPPPPHAYQFYSPPIPGNPYFAQSPAPFAPPFGTPPRPSSAEAHAAHHSYPLPPPSGLPTAVHAHHSGSGLPNGAPDWPMAQGERATRISHHLRMTSRHRSVSPHARSYADAAAFIPAVGQGGGQHIANEDVLHAHSNLFSAPPALPIHQDTLLVPGSPEPTTNNIVSPRPMLSPKASFSVDPVTQTGTSKSERVEHLEHIAAVADIRHADMSADMRPATLDALGAALGRVMPDVGAKDKNAARVKAMEDVRDKTLPGPPVPSGKERVLSAMAATRPRADMLFKSPASPTSVSLSPPSQPVEEKTPPTPTLTAFSPGKHPRSKLSVNGLLSVGVAAGAVSTESGLDALERKLLAHVGTRKLDDDGAARATAIPDVRAVVQAGPSASASVSPIAIPGRGVGDAGPTTPLNDSAISSLTLSNARSVDEKTQHGGGLGAGLGARLGLGLGLGMGGPATVKKGGGHRRAEAGEARSDVDESSKAQDGEGSGATRPGRKREKEKEKDQAKEDKTKGADVMKMRKAAKGRVAAWLENISPDAPPEMYPVASSLEPVIPVGNEEASKAEAPAEIPADETAGGSRLGSGTDVANGGSSAAPRVQPNGVHKERDPATDVSAAPNPRSSGFVPIGTQKHQFPVARQTSVRKTSTGAGDLGAPQGQMGVSKGAKPSPRLPVFPPPQEHGPEVKYDVRSARGGKGGKVAAVTAIFASQVESPKAGPAPPTSKPVVASKPHPALKPKVVPPPVPALPVGTSVRAGAAVAQSVAVPAPPTTAARGPPKVAPKTGDLSAATRARMIKSASVPAQLSSLVAKPSLSSTASLARPPASSASASGASGTSTSSSPLLGLGLAKMRSAGKLANKAKLPPTVSEGLDGMGVVSSHGEYPPRPVPALAPAPASKATAADKPKTEMAFGQARLRDLIRKYQGQAS